MAHGTHACFESRVSAVACGIPAEAAATTRVTMKALLAAQRRNAFETIAPLRARIACPAYLPITAAGVAARVSINRGSNTREAVSDIALRRISARHSLSSSCPSKRVRLASTLSVLQLERHLRASSIIQPITSASFCSRIASNGHV
jgi:hypothetical protein